MPRLSHTISLLFVGFSCYYGVACSSLLGVNYLVKPSANPPTCSDSDLHTFFNFLWNDYKIVLKKVTNEEYGSDQQEKNYVLLHKLDKINSERVLGVANIKQSPNASFSYEGVLFNGDKIEIQLLNSVSTSYIMYRHLKTQNFISLHFGVWDGSSGTQQEDTKVWKMKLMVNSDFVLDLVWSTNCSINEKPSVIMKTCWFELSVTVPSIEVLWMVKGCVHTSQFGSSLVARLERNDAVTFEPIRLEANWTITDVSWIPHQLSADLILGVQSVLSLNVNSSNLDEEWKLDYGLNSRVFDWHFFGNLNFKATIDEHLVVLTSQMNYLLAPSKTPIKYSFGYIQSNNGSRIVDLRHNITSPLYIFEGNMTVEKDKNSAVVTEIWQKVNSPVAKGLFMDLHQIFHQSGFWNWETVVMKSGLVDMHVSGHWNNSVLDYYRKRFQFHSHTEESIPSFSLTLEYNNRLHFHNQFHFPFLALAYGVTLNLTPYSLLPIDLQVSMHDEFISNFSYPISKVNFYQNNGTFNFEIDSNAEMHVTIKLLHLHLIKIMSWDWKSSQHPLNQLLQPIMRRPTLKQATNDLFIWFSKIPEIDTLVSRIIGLF